MLKSSASKTTKPVAETGDGNGHEYRHNPQYDAKIDDWIKNNPKHWAYIQALPPDRMTRALALNEVRKIEQKQKYEAGILRRVNENPEERQAYETLVKDLPEGDRNKKIVSLAREKNRKPFQRTADQQQAQGTKSGVGV